MTVGSYRLAVFGAVFAWFMLGLHVPALHQMTHHGRTPGTAVLAATALLTVAAVAAVWVLLRAHHK